MEAMDPFAQPRKPTWLVENVWMKGKINGLFGPEKAGKSRLVGWLLAHAFHGTGTFGLHASAPKRLLYLCGEEQPEDVAGRIRMYHDRANLDMSAIEWRERVTFCHASGMRLEQPRQRRWLEEEVLGGGYDTLLIDPLRRVHGASENSNDEMAPLLNWLRQASNQHNLTVILFHHTGNLREEDDMTRIATWSRGATDLPAILDWAVFMRRFKRTSGYDVVNVYAQGRAPDPGVMKLADRGDENDQPWVRVK